jgi:glycosyltransferase involved in cell wall biosynthesis
MYGGGITLSNLFRGWDEDKIAVVATGHVMYRITTDICTNYYQLGCDEFKWKFPFSYIQRKFPSGPLSIGKVSDQKAKKNKSALRNIVVDRIFYPVLEWLGLFHSLSKLRLTPGLQKWLSDFNPELLYIQVSTRDTILFASELKEYLKVPSVIHVMDDWPSTISKNGIFKKYWEKKIDGEFRELLDGTNLFLSISDAMSSEYKKRYNKDFISFHNPIDIQFWNDKSRTGKRFMGEQVKVLFSGRIGIGIEESLMDLLRAVESLVLDDINVKLYIQSPSKDNKTLNKLRTSKSLVINPVAEYSELPRIFSEADILAIINDFDRESIDYLRYSMPTKVSEYMISGTPIIVYSHAETAVSRFFTSNKCGHCVYDRNLNQLKDALILIIKDEEYRQELSSRAIRVASELFDANTVRLEFRDLLKKTALINK